MPRVTLTKPIKPGFRRPISLVPDEALDQQPGGGFATIETLSGDSTSFISPDSTAMKVNAFLNADGATGENVVLIRADGHLGDGVQEISQEIAYTVANPDATQFGPVTEGADEPIPT
jgi:hypothetical protein